MIRDNQVTERLKNNPFESVHSILTDLLREEILNNSYTEGERLIESEISSKYGLSRTTVRRSFETLTNEGWLVYDNNKGVSIKKLEKRSYEQLCELRIYLDPVGAQLAAIHRTESDLAEMEKILNSVPAKASLGDLLKLDTAFHKAIYNASHNDYLINAYDYIGIELARNKMFLAKGSSLLKINDIVRTEHRLIYRCIMARNTSGAATAARTHAMVMLDDLKTFD